DHHLDRAEIGLHLLQSVDAGLVRRHVPLVDRNAGLGFELLRRLVIAAVVGGYLVAGRLQRLGDRLTDPARSTRHHRYACHPPVSSIAPRAPHRVRRNNAPHIRNPGCLLKFPKSQFDQRSTHMAMPMPPPMQSVAKPFLALRFCISCRSVTSTRAPDAPIGCPNAIAPPLTFTFDVSQPRSLLTAQACAANASFASTRSRSPTCQPAFFSAARVAGIGPVPMIAGSTPACAHEAIRASGALRGFCASLAFISTTAAAPSLMPEALAAVTVPSLAKAGRSLLTASIVTPCLGNSSTAIIRSPLRVLTVTEAISSPNRPA